MSADLHAPFSRRRLLAGALGVGAAVGLGGAVWWRRAGGVRAPDGLRCLSRRQYATLGALAAALLPTGGAFARGAGDVDLAAAFDTFLADEPPWNQRDLSRALLLLELGPLVYDRRLSTFSALPEPERLAHFRAWAEGDDLLRRQIASALLRFLYLVFYDDPAVWPELGYGGPLVSGGTP